jgi:TRAP-type mannitol/chloroaromatic compound transport system permease small subunit
VIVVMVVFMVGHSGNVANRRAGLNVPRGSPGRPVTMRSPISLIPIAEGIERLTGAVGRAAMWCLLAAVLLQFLVVVARYAMGLGSLWLTESIIYAHAALFMLAAAWTLAENGHVRVDVFYADAAPRRKALVDLLGALLLLIPFALTLALLSLPYVGRSWAILERSREASGLPAVFLLKTLIPLFAVLMVLQGVAQAIRAAAVLWRRDSVASP